MYIITSEKFHLIPLAYNEFCKDIESLVESKKYAGAIEIDRIIDKDTVCRLIDYCSKDRGRLYVLDMQHIVSYENRALNMLLDCSDIKIIIVNIDNGLIENVKEDLQEKYRKMRGNILYSHKELGAVYDKLASEIEGIYKALLVNTVKWLRQIVTKEDIQNLRPLDSSGVYCNMYINAKRLFTDPAQYSFVVYHMVKMIKECNINADALVSASRNGANIASILGWLLDMKVIHCASLGPKFSLVSGSIDTEIRKHKKYIYIFDFLCLGTEVKLLNALLNIKEAKLVAGFGIANYRNLENVSKLSVLAKIFCLVDVQKENFGYRIAGTKEEIAELLMEEDRDYGTARLQRI